MPAPTDIAAHRARRGLGASVFERHAPSGFGRGPAPGGATGRRLSPAAAIVGVVAVALALSPLWTGYYDTGKWEPLALGAIVLLVVAALGARVRLSRFGVGAAAGLGALLALSVLSMLWAESKESAWTDSSRLALYAVIFAIGLLAIRERRSARAIVLILGLPALISSAVLCIELIAGSGGGAFFQGRLDRPIGYINGTAGLLSMGLWPWLALSDTSERRAVRAGAFAASALIAGTVVLTQSRSIVPATVVTVVLLVVAAGGRARRGILLALMAVSVAVSLHWTLKVYPSTGAAQALAPSSSALRGAGLAILAGTVFAGAARLLLSLITERGGASGTARFTRWGGRALLAAVGIGVLLAVTVGGSSISRQYRAFTHLQVNQAAPNRFLDAGGFRYDLWRIAVKEFKANPLGGVGAGNYDRDYYRLRHNPQYVVQPHSLELQMAAELGIGGLLALLAFALAVLWAGLSPRGTLAAEDRLVRLGALGIFASWLAATSVDWLYDIPGLAGMAVLAAALLVVPGGSAVSAGATAMGAPPAGLARRPSRGRRGQAALVVGLGLLALLAAGIGRQYAAGRYQRSGQDQVAQSPRAAIGPLTTALQLDPYSLQTLYTLASAYARLDDYNDARATLLAAERREPHNYVPPALLGDLATRRGDFAVAAAAYQRSLSLNPRDPTLQQDVQQARAGQ